MAKTRKQEVQSPVNPFMLQAFEAAKQPPPKWIFDTLELFCVAIRHAFGLDCSVCTQLLRISIFVGHADRQDTASRQLLSLHFRKDVLLCGGEVIPDQDALVCYLQAQLNDSSIQEELRFLRLTQFMPRIKDQT